jgi:hypothetical protein
MGGGDLNMKKGHHPATMKNLEKKWLAEQKRDTEKKKIEQLQRELEEERAREEVKKQAIEAGLKKESGRVDWMYQHMAIDREQYLLGKTIDKYVDPTYNAEQERQATDGPGALFAGDAVSVSNDMASKIREDPLFHIRKKEDEHKKALLNNPVKMKQIQQMLRESLASDKDKKKKKKHHDNDKRQKKSKKISSRSRSGSPVKLRRQSRSRSRSPISRRSHSDNHGDRQKGRSWLPGNDRHGHSYQDRLQGREKGHLQRDRPHYAERARLPGRKKMDKVEMERRRAEMMDNARRRDKEREMRVQQYRVNPNYRPIHTCKMCRRLFVCRKMQQKRKWRKNQRQEGTPPSYSNYEMHFRIQ